MLLDRNLEPIGPDAANRGTTHPRQALDGPAQFIDRRRKKISSALAGEHHLYLHARCMLWRRGELDSAYRKWRRAHQPLQADERTGEDDQADQETGTGI